MRIINTLIVLLGLLIIFPQQNSAQVLKGIGGDISSLEKGYCSNDNSDNIVPDNWGTADSIKWSVYTREGGNTVPHDDWFDLQGTGINTVLVFFPNRVDASYYGSSIIFKYTLYLGGNDKGTVTDWTKVNEPPTVFNFGPATAAICDGDAAVLTLEQSEDKIDYFLYLDGGIVDPVPTTGDGKSILFYAGEEGNYTVKASASGCYSMMNGTSDVTVHSNPVVSAGNDTIVCEGGDINLKGNASDGATPYQYSWVGPNFTADSKNATVSPVTTNDGGKYYLTVTDANTCSGIDSMVAVVNKNPVAIASNNGPFCEGDTLKLTVTVTEGLAPFTYVWTGPDNFTSTDEAPVINRVTVANAGDYYVTVTDANDCGSATVSTTVSISVAPRVNPASNSPVCEYGMLQLIANPDDNGATPYSFSWEGPQNYTSTDENPAINNIQLLQTGNYTLVATDNNGCSSLGDTTIVLVNDTPVANAGNDTIVCTGGTLSLHGSATEGTGVYTYDWVGPDGFTSNLQNPVINNVTFNAIGVYTLTVNDGNCSATSTVNISVTDELKVTALADTVCEKTTLHLSSVPTGGTGAYSFSWTGPNGFTSALQNPSINNVTVANNEGNYIVTVTDPASCVTIAKDTFTVIINPSPVVDAISNNSPICEGDTLRFYSEGSGGTGALTFSWRGPYGYTSAEQNPYISNAADTISGVYTVIVTDIKSCTDTASTSAVVNKVTATITASDGAVICAGTPVTFNGRGTDGSNNYNYDFHVVRGGVDSSVQNGNAYTWTVDTLADNDEVYVVVTDNNTLCTDESGSIFVIVHPNPVVTLKITNGNDTICSGTNVEFTAEPGFANYVYYVDGDIAQSGANNVYTTDSLTNGQRVSVNITTVDGCSSSTPAIQMTVYKTPVAVLTANPGTDIIEGTNVIFTAGGGTMYEFYVNGVEVQARSNDNTIETDTLSNGVVVSVNVYGEGDCVSTASLTMTVKEGIAPLDVSATATEYCMGSGGVSIYIAAPQTGITYELINTTDNSVISTIIYDGTNTVQWDNILGDHTYKVEGYYADMPNDRVEMNNTITVTENPLPVKYLMSPTGVQTGCNSGNGYEIKLVKSDVGYIYQLLINNNNIGAPVVGTGDTISFGTYVNIGIYNVLAINNVTGCTNIMDGTFEIKSDDSYTRYDVTGDGEFCEGEAGAFVTLEGSDVNIEYKVLVDGTDVDTWTADVTTGHTFGPYQAEGNYTIVVASSGGCNYPMNGSVNVVSIPLPLAFDLNVENGGHFCEGDVVGVEISISGQQKDILYKLYRDNVFVTTDTGKVDDANMVLSFGSYHETGQYSVVAETQGKGCSEVMNNEIMLYEDPLPNIYDVTTDGDYCTGSVTYLHLNGSEPDVRYRWETETGVIGAWVDGNGGLLDFEIAGTDTYYIMAQRKDVVTACSVEMNGRIAIVEKPFADLTKTLRIKAGTGLACDNGAVVIVENSELDVVYELYKGYQTGNTTNGNGSDAEFAPVVDVDATYQVLANLNGCQDVLNDVIYINITGVIKKFGVTGSGDICNGDPGVKFGLTGTEAGIVYKLYLVDGNGTGNDKQIGAPIVGTGNAVTFDLTNEEGEYYVIGDNGVNCMVEMTNRVTLTVNPLPVAFTMIGSGYFCDVNEGAEIGLDGQEYSVKYVLQYDDGSGNRNWGEATGGTTNDTIIFGKYIDEGLYTVLGITEKGCTSNMHGEVIVSKKPAPVNYNVLISDTAYCSGEPGVEFLMKHSEQNVVYTVYDEFDMQVNETIGTGADSLSLGTFTKGLYTVLGTYGGDACEAKMNDGDSIRIYEFETPVKFNVSSPHSNVCGSAGNTIILDGSENGRKYMLYEDGVVNSDTLIGTGDTLRWTVYSAGADTILYEVIAASEGSCNLSMGTTKVIYKNSPIMVNLITEDDTTQYCAGLPGIVIGIDTSEVNIGYQLLDELNNIVDFIAGSGDTAYFNNPHVQNNYTVKAVDFNTGCFTLMDDTIKVIENPMPEIYKMFLRKSDGSTSECENQCTGLIDVDTIKLEMSQDFVDYLLWLKQPNLETTTVDTVRGILDELSFGARSEGGLYSIEGVTEQGCRAFMSGSAYLYQSPLIANNDIFTLSNGELIGEVDVVENDILLEGIDSLADPNKNIFFKLDTSWTYFDEENVAQQYSTVGEVSISDQGKLEYKKLPSFYGRDSVRYVVYNSTRPERIDTATVFIFVGNIDLGNGETFLIPNAFSPNGDNINDKFVITGIEAKQESKLEVFNRWGTMVYRSSGQNYNNEWDGKSTESSMVSAGDDLPNGTYFYVFSVKINIEGKVVTREYSGYIELRR